MTITPSNKLTAMLIIITFNCENVTNIIVKTFTKQRVEYL